MTVKQVMQNLRTIEKLRVDYLLNLYRAILDLIICTNELDLFHKVLGKRLNVGFEGAFGMSAALIHLYSLRRILRKKEQAQARSSSSASWYEWVDGWMHSVESPPSSYWDNI